MKKLATVFASLLATWASASWACELPTDNSYYLTAMQEERQLTLDALTKSDMVVVGTVLSINYGPEKPDPSDRISDVRVQVNQVLFSTVETPSSIDLKAKLHEVTVVCFGNEDFWDDQVEQNAEYIFFISERKILSASGLTQRWRKLGLAGQREIVLSANQTGR